MGRVEERLAREREARNRPRRFSLTDEDRDRIIRNRASGVPAAERTGYVGTVEFRGPRGRRYRTTWIAVRLTVDEAIADVETIRKRRYAAGAFPTRDDVVEVDAYGEEVVR